MKIQNMNKSTKSRIDYINKKLKKIIPDDFYKQSSHIARSAYVAYLNKFKETKLTIPQLITKYLHHDGRSNSSIYYQHIKLADDVDDFINSFQFV